MIDRTDPAHRLVAVADLMHALTGTSMALRLAIAGVQTMEEAKELPDLHGEGLRYLCDHQAILVEAVRSLAEGKPPRWNIHHVLADVPSYEVQP
jgi:hypothetical protein